MKAESKENLQSALWLLESADEGERARFADYPEGICFSDFRKMSDDEVFDRMNGSAITDDPPEEWDKKQLAQFLRGYLYAEYKRSRYAHHSYVRPMRFIKEVLDTEAEE